MQAVLDLLEKGYRVEFTACHYNSVIVKLSKGNVYREFNASISELEQSRFDLLAFLLKKAENAIERSNSP